MAAGEKFHGSNLKLAGYLKLLDNPIYLGLSDNAYITTTLNDIDITNSVGDININSTEVYFNADLIYTDGLFKYLGDYSGIYDNRTLVDKEYVDGVISAGGTADNGLTRTLSNVQLGGPLIQNTTVDGDTGTYDLSLIDIKFLQLDSTETLIESATGKLTMTSILPCELNSLGNDLRLNAESGNIILSWTDGAYLNSSIVLSSSGNIITDNINEAGLVYAADYSLANIVNPRWLVDKDYVDTQLSLIGVSYWDVNTANELVLNLGVPGPVVPHTTNIVDFGSISYKWRDLFLSGSINKVTVNNAYTLPSVDGTNNQVLKTNGLGVVTWQNESGGGASNLADLNDVNFTTGTPNTGDLLTYNGSTWEAISRSSLITTTFNVTGAINSVSATNMYLDSDGAGIYLTPYILPDDAVLSYMSASCATTGTWTAEVHVNGTLFTGATLTVTAAKKAYIKFNTVLSFSAGDEIQLYLNGTNINKPRISAVFVTVP